MVLYALTLRKQIISCKSCLSIQKVALATLGHQVVGGLGGGVNLQWELGGLVERCFGVEGRREGGGAL